jgi:hypothetical protein
VNSFPNDTNPYAPPVPVEEDAASYDLLKIARLYNRLGVVLKWFVPLLVVDVILFMSGIFLLMLVESPHSTVAFPETIRIGVICFIMPVHVSVCFLLIYGAFLLERIARAMKYRGVIMLLILLGAIANGINIIVMILMLRKAAQILRDSGIEITGGKVDLAKIPLENDY